MASPAYTSRSSNVFTFAPVEEYTSRTACVSSPTMNRMVAFSVTGFGKDVSTSSLMMYSVKALSSSLVTDHGYSEPQLAQVPHGHSRPTLYFSRQSFRQSALAYFGLEAFGRISPAPS